jgi:hypothetical protein
MCHWEFIFADSKIVRSNESSFREVIAFVETVEDGNLVIIPRVPLAFKMDAEYGCRTSCFFWDVDAAYTSEYTKMSDGWFDTKK